MSFSGPALAAAPAAMAAATQGTFDILLSTVNTNPYFIGLMMIFMNLGGRFLGLEISPKQEQFFQHPLVRRLLIFTVLFIATRNIWVAFWLTIVIVLLVGYLLNEKSSLCLFHLKGLPGSSCEKEGFVNATPIVTMSTLSPLEEEIFQKLLQKRSGGQGTVIKENKDETAPEDLLKRYVNNIDKLQSVKKD